jgi:hypothetical protein
MRAGGAEPQRRARPVQRPPQAHAVEGLGAAARVEPRRVDHDEPRHGASTGVRLEVPDREHSRGEDQCHERENMREAQGHGAGMLPAAGPRAPRRGPRKAVFLDQNGIF